MNKRSVSIEDIATAAGVSTSTVSRALRDSPLISADVRANVQRLAQELGYTPNAIAQSLQMRRTNAIGLVVTTIADPFFSDVVHGVEAIARPAGLSVFLSTSHNDPKEEKRVIETFHRRRADGLIIAASRIGSEHLKRLAHVRVPTVLVNGQADAQYDFLHSVAVDDYLGAQTAVAHLLELGHRSIGYIGAGSRPKSNRRRLIGYRDALAAAGIAWREEWAASAACEAAAPDDDVTTGQDLLAPLLSAGVTAIFCYNDMIAVGVLTACREQGIRVPEQLSVVGFDDIAVAQYVTPPLTTIRQPRAELGRQAMRMLLDLLHDRPVENSVLPVELIRRGSTARPPSS